MAWGLGASCPACIIPTLSTAAAASSASACVGAGADVRMGGAGDAQTRPLPARAVWPRVRCMPNRAACTHLALLAGADVHDGKHEGQDPEQDPDAAPEYEEGLGTMVAVTRDTGP